MKRSVGEKDERIKCGSVFHEDAKYKGIVSLYILYILFSMCLIL
jgi:hypothetical protein